jgi:hypothetical protein
VVETAQQVANKFPLTNQSTREPVIREKTMEQLHRELQQAEDNVKRCKQAITDAWTRFEEQYKPSWNFNKRGRPVGAKNTS